MLKFKKFGVCLGALLFLSACHPMTKEQLLAKGTQCLAKGDPRGAAIYLSKALKKDPGFTDAGLKLARAYEELAKFDSATGQIEDILKKDPSNIKAHIELARVYLEQSKPDQALAELKKLPSPASSGAAALEEDGWAYALRKDYPAALSFFQKALQGGGNYVEINLLMAKVYDQMGDMGKTREALDCVFRKDPSNPQAIQLFAALQLKANDMDGAIQTYARAGKNDLDARFREGMLLVLRSRQGQADSVADSIISDFAHRPEGYLVKGFSLCSLKNYNGAIEYLRKSITMGETPQAHFYLGLCLYHQNELELAYNELDKAAAMDPSFAAARNLAGLILLRQGRVDEAISQLKQLTGSGQGNAFSYDILGGAYAAKDMYSSALDELGRATAMDPSLKQAYIQKGLLLVSAGKYAQGESALQKAVSVETGAPRARLLLAQLYLKQGETAQALRTAGEGIKGDANDAPLYDFMAAVYARQGNVPAAEASLEKAKAADPASPEAYFYLASVYRQTGRTAAAVRELETLCQKNPGNVQALVDTAMLLGSTGDGAGALKYYTLALNSGDPAGYLYFAAYELKAKKTADALSTLAQGIAKNPSAAELYEMKGAIQMHTKDYNGAIGTFTSLEKVDRQAGFDLLVKGYMAMNRPADALRMVRQAASKSPQDISLLATLSSIYGTMGNQGQALSAARQMISINPSSPLGYMQLASVQSRYSLDAAIATLNGPQTPRDGRTEMFLGGLYFRKKDYSRAEGEFQAAGKSMPEVPGPVYRQALAMDEMGRRAEAAAAYRKVLSLAPGYLPAINNLAYYYDGPGGNPALGLRLAARAYAIAPNDGNVLDTYGFALLKNGKAPEALKTLERSHALLPANPTIGYHLALAYVASGKKDQAAGLLRKCLGMGNFPEARPARELLARLTTGNGRQENARLRKH